ncbi:MAG: sigma-70 family RNA polymerase sigma factor [Faecalicatena sp.]|uniref:RNA polymerase sigma factor n=1 Tax=Faecalicatena sp. TaxID=2005360 RepID=UPI002582FDC5|nr:sigma-70 family RNA polymerase sigma factor [Faecalicatena sp.]MCI6465634.1 sigma-70 family RNA polymerase sigma factor [Faecalicatena sp.]MDY5618092.1 sigma-70 family RNA polymerase sigma factor [Lachnospiraceae bacterium]
MVNLVKRAQAGDQDAFIQLIEENKQALYKVAVSMLKNDADVADVIQDTILSSYENLRGLREPKYFKTWLTRILINHCNRILKERQKVVPMKEQLEAGEMEVDTSGREFLRLLNKLEDQYRIVLLLYYVEGFSIKEIGTILEMNENTVKTRLSRGRTSFKKVYLKENTVSIYRMEG